MYLTENPYIEFNSNKYTDPLINNWEIIRDQYWYNCKHEKLMDNNGWINTIKGFKTNSNTSAHFPGILYEGVFKATSVMIKHNMLDSKEKADLNWKENENIRWWPNRMVRMPIISKYITDHSNIIAGVTFSTSMPNSVLNFHWGLDPDYLRIHLCLDEANGCKFNIEGWERQWKDGYLFGFDDANVLHGTTHTGNKTRTILLIDIKKDVLKPYAKTWPCRVSRPNKEHWNLIKESCSIIKQS